MNNGKSEALPFQKLIFESRIFELPVMIFLALETSPVIEIFQSTTLPKSQLNLVSSLFWKLGFLLPIRREADASKSPYNSLIDGPSDFSLVQLKIMNIEIIVSIYICFNFITLRKK
jgi:hypothetical protein